MPELTPEIPREPLVTGRSQQQKVIYEFAAFSALPVSGHGRFTFRLTAHHTPPPEWDAES